jgi:FkbM family methyltransferase
LKKLVLFVIRIGRVAFYNTPIHRLRIVTVIYERLFHLAFDREKLVEVSCHGLLLKVPGKDITILPSLLNQAYEEFELQLLERLLRPGMIFVDVGANIGIYSSIAARSIAPLGTVYSFEPVPENFTILKDNLTSNGLTNVILEQVAVGEINGVSILYLEDDSIGTHSLLRHGSSYRIDQELEVEVITLDEYFADRMIATVDILKVDVEGYEPLVLKGGAALLRRTNQILIEYNRSSVKTICGIESFVELFKDFPYLYGISERSNSLSEFARGDFYSTTYTNLLASKTQVSF